MKLKDSNKNGKFNTSFLSFWGLYLLLILSAAVLIVLLIIK